LVLLLIAVTKSLEQLSSMDNILSRFKKVKAVFLDVDGVLTDGKVLCFENGEQVRQFSIKDGFAIATAVKKKLPIIIISAGQYEGVRTRLEYLKVKDINLGVKNKIELLKKYILDNNWAKEEVLYMGDDIPDYEALQLVGLPTCPADAVTDIIEVCDYISPYNGGNGAVRDVLEKILKLQGKWAI